MSFRIGIFADIIFAALIIGLSLFLSGFLLQGELLDIGYQDWLVQAYRIKMLSQFGFTSWIHNWSNGISSWQIYQFIPHYIALFTSNILNLSITKSMIVNTVFLFTFTRVSFYIILRILGFSQLTSFSCAILTFSVAPYWSGVKDYSLMYAFSLTPLYIGLWIAYFKKRLQYIFPLFIGISFYIHPILGMSIFLLWIFGEVISPKRIMSITFLFEIIVFLIGSSLFWLPIFLTRNYTFTNPYISTQDYLGLTLASYENLGFSIIILFSALMSIFVRKFDKNDHWFVPLLFFSFSLVLLIFLNKFVELPHFITMTQFTRAVPLVSFALIFLSAFLFERLYQTKIFILKLLLLSTVTITFVMGIEYSSVYGPEPKNTISDPLNNAIANNIRLSGEKGRIWTPTIGSSSFYSDSSIFFTNSYNEQLDSNPLAQRLNQYLNADSQQKTFTKSSILIVNNYLKFLGAKYVMLPSEKELSSSFLTLNSTNISKYFNVGDKEQSFVLVEMNWTPQNAIYISDEILNNPNFVYKESSNVTVNAIKLDEIVSSLTNSMDFSSENSIKAFYPQTNQITLNINNGKRSNYIFINESYDPNWKAFLDGEKVSIKKFGPNFMVVDLSKFNGNSLVLKHTWPIYHYVSVYLIIFLLFSIPTFRIGYLLTKRNKKKEKKLRLYEIN